METDATNAVSLDVQTDEPIEVPDWVTTFATHLLVGVAAVVVSQQAKKLVEKWNDRRTVKAIEATINTD